MIEGSDIIFKAVVGSHAHGTNIPESDIDIKGIYIQSPESVLAHGYREQHTINDDEVYYEFRRVIELCCKGNPTMLELLWSPEDCIQEKHPVMDMLIEVRDAFLSKSCKWSFGGYARDQIKKASGLKKKMNWEDTYKTRATVFDFCNVPDGKGGSMKVLDYLEQQGIDQSCVGLTGISNMKDCFGMFWSDEVQYKGIADENSNNVRLSSIPKDQMDKYLTVMHFNLDAYSKHCKKFKEYEKWLEDRNIQRYVDIDNHGQKIDGKNMLHCTRLIQMGREIAGGKGLIVRRPNSEYLISIRRGEVDLKTLLEDANQTLEEMDILFESNTFLPDTCDRGKFMKLMTKMRKEFYKQEK